MTRAVTPEVLPPASAGDSEDMRLAANYALQAHEMTTRGAQMMVVGALACGFILRRAKETLPHGQMERWERRYLRAIPRRTRKLYLRYATAIQRLHAAKCASVAHLLDVPPAELTAERMRAIAPKLREITDGKSLTELGRELGIVRQKNTKAERARRRANESPESRTQSALAWLSEVRTQLAQVRHHRPYLRPRSLRALKAALAAAIEEVDHDSN